jgi:predicted DsbA family dithiol-disulfide isomerase
MATKKITFFHSMICPRCFVAGRFLSRILQDFPGIEVEKVEVLTNPGRSREAGVSTIPALAFEGKTLSGFLLGPGRIREFVESVETE